MKNIRFTYGPSQFRFVGMDDPSDSDDHWKPFDFDYSDTDVTGPKILRYHDLCLSEAAHERAGRPFGWYSMPLRRQFNTTVKQNVVEALGLVGHRILKGPIENGATLISWTNVRDHEQPGVDNVGLAASCGAYPGSSIAALDALVAQMNIRRTVLTKDVTDLTGLVFAPDESGLYLFLPRFSASVTTFTDPNETVSVSASRTGTWSRVCDGEETDSGDQTPGSVAGSPFGTSGSATGAQYGGFKRVFTHHYVAHSETEGNCTTSYTESVETITETSTCGMALTGDSGTVSAEIGGVPANRLTLSEVQSMLDVSDAKVLVAVAWPSEYDNTSSSISSWRLFWSAHTRYMNGKVRAVSVPASIRKVGGQYLVDVTVAPSVFNGCLEDPPHTFNGSDPNNPHPLMVDSRNDRSTVEYEDAWRCDMRILGVAVKYNPREKPVT